MSEKKVAEAVKVTRTVKLQGRQVERLTDLNKRTQVLNEQTAKIEVEQIKVRAGIEALLGLNAEPGETATTYKFETCELILEKEAELEAPAAPVQK